MSVESERESDAGGPLESRGPGEDPGPGRDRPKNIFVLHGTVAFREWVHRLADYNRTNAASLVDQALVHYARAIGFDEPAPRR